MIEPHVPPASDVDGSLQPPTNVRWRILLLLMAYAGLVHYNRISMSSAGTEHIMKEYGIDETSMGMVYSSYLFLYTIFMLPGGWLLDKIGPKRALLVVGLGSALLVPMTGVMGYLLPPDVAAQHSQIGSETSVGTAGSSSNADDHVKVNGAKADHPEVEKPKAVPPLTATAWQMLVALCLIRALLGIISAPIHPGAARAISFWMPLPGRGKSNGLVTGAAVTGIALTPYLSGYLMDRLRWPNAFVIAGAVTLLLTVIWTLYATDHPEQHPDTNSGERLLLANNISRPGHAVTLHDSLTGMISMFQNRSLVLVGISYAAYSYVQYLFFYWLQYYFDVVLHLDQHTGRLYTTINLCAMVVGMLSGGWLVDRLQLVFGGPRSRAITPICGLVASGLFLLLGASCKDSIWVVTCMALSMGTLGLCEAPFWVTGVELGGRRGGLSGAFLNTIGNMGGIVGPVLTPFVSSLYGWQASLFLASSICVLGAIPWFWVNPNDGREQVELREPE